MLSLNIQPIPYQGSKRALAPRICAIFPDRIDTLYEPFAGSAAITLYAAHHNLADRFVIGDVFSELIDLWDLLINAPDELGERYEAVWRAQFESEGHFNAVRTRFNASRDSVDLLYLIARCVKNAVRFNASGNFTQSADKRRTGMKPERLRRTALEVSALLKGRTTLYRGPFDKCAQPATAADLVYLDPPYQGTTYGRDKRYAEQLERETLIKALHGLNRRSVPFVLSYDGVSGGRTYGEPLPASIKATRILLNAGRSSQATLAGRDDITFESVYYSNALKRSVVAIPEAEQISLFGQALLD